MNLINNTITIFRDQSEGFLKYMYDWKEYPLNIIQGNIFKIHETYSELINETEYQIIPIKSDDGIPTFRFENAVGTQGPQGFQGMDGRQGFTGPGVQGSQGMRGTQGSQGNSGEDGAPGVQGFQGDTGAQGAQGFQGEGVAPTDTFAGDVRLSGVSYPRVWGSNLPIGDNDLYTVPVGKKLLVYLNARYYNQSAGTINAFVELKSGGNYYRLSGNVVPLTLNTILGSTNATIVLQAGESLSINVATNNGLNCFFSAVQFDDSNALYTSKVLALINGINTIYTVPVGKTALLLGGVSNTLTRLGGAMVSNSSGGNVLYTYYNVPNGGVVGATNQATPATNVSNNTVATNGNAVTASMNAGDSVVVNSASAAAGQWAWVTYYEIP